MREKVSYLVLAAALAGGMALAGPAIANPVPTAGNSGASLHDGAIADEEANDGLETAGGTDANDTHGDEGVGDPDVGDPTD